MQKHPVIVIGHKNPDLDSVASAMAYAHLKTIEGESNVIAATPGEINRETSYVLNKMGINPPVVVTDVHARVEDLLGDQPGLMLQPHINIHKVGHLIRENSMKTLPVVDSEGRLLGVLTVGDLAMTFMNRLGDEMDNDKAGREVQSILETKISEIMKSENLVTFDSLDPVGEARQMMLKTRFRNYPVTDDDNRFLGMISRYDLLSMKRKQLILVDHNEKKQAVDGCEEAELLEVIDHHRVGDMESINPIYFRNEPVGATSTLIAGMYREKNLPLKPELAGLLLAGILSDTMIFRSPTTTDKDRETGQWLAAISKLSIDQWGREIFREASPLDVNDPQGLVSEDLKEYSYGKLTFAISQIETADLSILAAMYPTIIDAMSSVCAARGFDLMFLMVTDIFVEGTQLLIEGDKTSLGGRIFGDPNESQFFLQGVMSRKKQIVPLIFKGLAMQEYM
jgi:manganese-dependent inorganic pyrophosphatase